MKPRIGIKVTLVRLLAREKRKVVAADTGVAKLSYSSEARESYELLATKEGNTRNGQLTNRDTDIVHGIALPKRLAGRVEAELWEDERLDEGLRVWLEERPCRLGFDTSCKLSASRLKIRVLRLTTR